MFEVEGEIPIMWRGEVDHEKSFFPDVEQNRLAQLCKGLTPYLEVAGSMPGWGANLYHYYFCINVCRRGVKWSLVPSCASCCYYMSGSASTSSSNTAAAQKMMMVMHGPGQQQAKPFSSLYFIICLFLIISIHKQSMFFCLFNKNISNEKRRDTNSDKICHN